MTTPIPCPFAIPADVPHELAIIEVDVNVHAVCCSTCGCTGPIENYDNASQTPERAVELWNAHKEAALCEAAKKAATARLDATTSIADAVRDIPGWSGIDVETREAIVAVWSGMLGDAGRYRFWRKLWCADDDLEALNALAPQGFDTEEEWDAAIDAARSRHE